MEPRQGNGYVEMSNSPKTATLEELQEVGMEVQNESHVHQNFNNSHVTMSEEGNCTEYAGGPSQGNGGETSPKIPSIDAMKGLSV